MTVVDGRLLCTAQNPQYGQSNLYKSSLHTYILRWQQKFPNFVWYYFLSIQFWDSVCTIFRWLNLVVCTPKFFKLTSANQLKGLVKVPPDWVNSSVLSRLWSFSILNTSTEINTKSADVLLKNYHDFDRTEYLTTEFLK